jgi:molybdopterin synthase sulfur carrier subunit
MSVTFHIPGPLRQFTNGLSHVEIGDIGGIAASPATLSDALEALWAIYPGVRDRMATEQGQIREHINLFVGNENVRYTGGLATALPESAEISIVPAISGGLSFGQIRSVR